jgi:Fe-S-cluster containining protein
MTNEERRQLADSWMNASSDDGIVAELEAVYADAAAAIAERGPACWASGRCCNFEKTGHKLYATGLETAYCLGRLMTAKLWKEGAAQVRRAGLHRVERGANGHGRGGDQGAKGLHSLAVLPPGPMPTGRGLIADVEAAAARGGCPFQVRNLCGVHEIKPLGCRLYFCDRSAQEWQQELSERLLRDIRAIHDRHKIAYRYGEWLEMLNMFRS